MSAERVQTADEAGGSRGEYLVTERVQAAGEAGGSWTGIMKQSNKIRRQM